MYFNRSLVEYLEQNVTHPIQKRYGFTNYTLALWMSVVVLLFLFGILLDLLPLNKTLSDALVLVLNDTQWWEITIFAGIHTLLAHGVWEGTSRAEGKAFSRLESGLANPLKESFIASL